MDEQFSNLLRKISKYLFIGVAAILVLLLLLALLRVSVGFWLWSTVETWATVRLGLDSDAAQLVTVILVSLITLLLPTLAWYFLWGKKQLWATGIVVGGQILIFLLVSTIGSGVCFDRNTGEPLCWYADIPGKGRVISRTKGFDPVTGEEYKLYTRELARSSTPKVTSSSNSSSVTSSTDNPSSISIPFSQYSKANWNEYGVGIDEAKGGGYPHIWMRAVGSITYEANLPQTKKDIVISVRLSSELNDSTSGNPAYSSDVTLLVNGQKQGTQNVITDNGVGRDYQWTVSNSVLRSGNNQITFKVGDGNYKNGIAIYSPIQLRFQ